MSFKPRYDIDLRKLKLFGAAIAAMPDEARNITLICTPIAVPFAQPDKIEVLDELKFRSKFKPAAPDEVSGVLDHLATVMTKLTGGQRHMLESRGLQYRPVALTIGEDSRNPMLDRGYNEGFLRMFYDDSDIIKRNPTYGEPKKWNVPNDRDIAERNHIYGGTEKWNVPRLIAALEDCSLSWGSYSQDIRPHMHTPDALDRRVGKLLKRFEGGSGSAGAKLRTIAHRMGESVAMQNNFGGHIFQHSIPSGFEDDPAVQKRFPSLTFYHRVPGGVDAFRQGYQRTLATEFTESFKMPLDPHSPPFVNPCADRIRDQIQIVLGRRREGAYKDESRDREALLLPMGMVTNQPGFPLPAYTDMASARKGIWPTGGSKRADILRERAQERHWSDRASDLSREDTDKTRG